MNTENSILILEGFKPFFGKGIGKKGLSFGTICFNTSMTGYEEIITDPSYTGQIITFTFPHIGNTGINYEDYESSQISASGIVIGSEPTNSPSHFKCKSNLDNWLNKNNIVGICDVNTRIITKIIRENNSPIKSCIYYGCNKIDTRFLEELYRKNSSQLPLIGSNYALRNAPLHSIIPSNKKNDVEGKKVILIDYGTKKNIISELEQRGCAVKIVSSSASFSEIKKLNPDGICLSNGPGDPQTVYEATRDVLKEVIASEIPIFGICFGFQLLSLVFGGVVSKMTLGHHGANHPVRNIETGQVEITSQNHEFMVDAGSLPDHIIPTHISLFDGTLSGLKIKNKPIFAVQFHPEASPGPHDSKYLFDQFIKEINTYAKTNRY